jgi:hypothetical protein
MECFLGEKRIRKVAHLPVVGVWQDFDDIKAGDHVAAIEHFEPFLGGLNQAALFFAIHGLVWGAEGFCGPGFNFHKDEFGRAPDTADQIDFPAAKGAEVAVEDFVAGLFEKTFRDSFAFPAECRRFLFRRKGGGFPEGIAQPG